MTEQKTEVEEFNADHLFIEEGAGELFAHLIHGFTHHIENRELYSLSIQSTLDGDYRFVIKCWHKGPGGTRDGEVSFGNSESVTGLLASVESCLKWDYLTWRRDKFAREEGRAPIDSDRLRRVSINP